MPQVITLQPTPNQSLSFTLDGIRYVVTIKTLASGSTVATIERDGVTIVSGHLVVPNRFVLPYRYMRGEGGNFMLMTDGETLPDYKLFGTEHNLLYYSPVELA